MASRNRLRQDVTKTLVEQFKDCAGKAEQYLEYILITLETNYYNL